jgi:Tol biopolymer transport system component
LESGETRELAPEFEHMHYIRWSAGGEKFITHGFDKKGRTGLFSIDIRTGEFDLLLECQQEEYIPELDVFPDGQRIVYKMWEQGKGGESHRMSIRIRDLQSVKDEELYRRENAWQTHSIALSSDGKWIAFDDQVPLRTLNVIQSAGGEAAELWRMKPGESLVSLAWRPGSQELFFVQPADPNQLWRMSLEDKEPQRIDLSMRGMRELRFHPDGNRMAFYAGYLEAEVWVMENLLRLERKDKVFK